MSTLDSDEYAIEMVWPCADTTCPQINPGLALECSRCGRPKVKNNDVMPADTSEAAAITDARKLRRALAGPSWKCVHCDLMAPAGAPCERCGAPCPGGEVVAAQDPRPAPDKQWAQPARLPRSPAPRSRPAPMPRQGWGRDDFGFSPRPRPASTSPWGKALLVLAGFAACVAIAYLLHVLTRTREIPAVVQGVSWTHTVFVDRWEASQGEGWEAPFDAVHVHVIDPRRQNGSREAWDHDDLIDDPNAPTDCGQTCKPVAPVCKPLGNGTAKCKRQSDVCTPKPCPKPEKVKVPRTRSEPTYAPWLGWEAWDWTLNVRHAREQGTTMETRWPAPPEVPVAVEQRLRVRREATYAAVFLAEGKLYPVTFATEEAFQRHPVGTPATLIVSLLGATPKP